LTSARRTKNTNIHVDRIAAYRARVGGVGGEGCDSLPAASYGRGQWCNQTIMSRNLCLCNKIQVLTDLHFSCRETSNMRLTRECLRQRPMRLPGPGGSSSLQPCAQPWAAGCSCQAHGCYQQHRSTSITVPQHLAPIDCAADTIARLFQPH